MERGASAGRGARFRSERRGRGRGGGPSDSGNNPPLRRRAESGDRRRRDNDEDETVLDSQDISSVTSQDQGLWLRYVHVSHFESLPDRCPCKAKRHVSAADLLSKALR